MSDAPYPQRQPQNPPGGAPGSYETRRDVEAALAARTELGPEYSDHIAAGLAERVEQLAALRTAELRHDSERANQGSSLEKTSQTQRFVLGLASVTAGIPITITGLVADNGLPGIFIAWVGIVGVNVAHAWGNRRRR